MLQHFHFYMVLEHDGLEPLQLTSDFNGQTLTSGNEQEGRNGKRIG